MRQEPAIARFMLLADRVLFIDAEALIIDKPSGLPVDPPRDGSVSVDAHRSNIAFGFHRWPTPVHRLDRDTSGCLLLARTAKAHARFQKAFEASEVTKRYLAILSGVPTESEGVVDMALSKTSTAETGWRMIADAKGKSAVTHWRMLAERDGKALVEFRPETGRTHQLRVHAASGIGIAIKGDPVYGLKGGPMMLHASFLSMLRAGKNVAEATAPLPPHFAGWTLPE